MLAKDYTLNLRQVRQLDHYPKLQCHNPQQLQFTYYPSRQQQSKIINQSVNKEKDKIGKKILRECYQAINHAYHLIIHTVTALYGELAKLCLDETIKVKSRSICKQTLIPALQRLQSNNQREQNLSNNYAQLLQTSLLIIKTMQKLQRQAKIQLFIPYIPTQQQLFHFLIKREGLTANV